MQAVQRLFPVVLTLLCITRGWSRSDETSRVVVLDLRQSAWRFRLVRGTTEYLTAPDKVERVIYRWAAANRRPAPEISGIHRVDGELITPDEFAAALT